MENKLGKTLARTLLYSASAMALSAGAASATDIIGAHIGAGNPFFFGDKSVYFDVDPQDCESCDRMTLRGLGPDSNGHIGFRIDFTDIVQRVGQSGNRRGGDEPFSEPNSFDQELGFTVTAGPMYKIIGAILEADAGVSASVGYTANGEEGGSTSGSVSATADVDIRLTEMTNLFDIDLDSFYDASASAMNLNGSNVNPPTDAFSGTSMVMDALDAAPSYTFGLSWAAGTTAACDLSALSDDPAGGSSAQCTWAASAGIAYIDVRFKQMRMDIPEPGTLALFGLGLAGLVAARRKRKI